MLKAIISSFGMICIACLAGCGGGNSDSQSSFTVRINTGRVVPKYDTVGVNDSVQFINVDTIPNQVVSGTLDPQGSALVIHLISIGNTGFSPVNTTGDLGDTVRFSNDSMSTFVLDIVDDNGTVIASINLPVGNQSDFSFSSAGLYTIRNRNNSLFVGTVTLFGHPNPNGIFQSPVLNNGDTFTRQFTTGGSFPYYILNINHPDQSFITGNISVQ